MQKVINNSANNKQNDITERFKIAFQQLLNKEEFKTQSELAGILGWHQSSLNSVLKGIRNIPIEVAITLCDKYHLNKDWMLKGQGEMFMDKMMFMDPSVDYVKNTGNIIQVPVEAYAGLLRGYKDSVFLKSLKRYSVEGVGERWEFPIEGLSMYPKENNPLAGKTGDKAWGIKQENLNLFKGRGYIVQTIDGIAYKIFDKIVGEMAYFKSLDEEFDGLTCKLKDIKVIYLVDEIRRKTS